MNEDATIKILSKLRSLEGDLQWAYQEYFSNQINDDQFSSIINSTDREIEVYLYIYNLIIQDLRKN